MNGRQQERRQSVDVTEAMIDAGIGEFMEYELGGMSVGEMVRRVFVSMTLAASSMTVPAQEVHEPR